MKQGGCGCGCGETEIEHYRPLTELTELLSRKYALYTIGVIDAHGPMRFQTLNEHLPEASSATLSDRLAGLTEAGLITRTQFEEVPLRVEYELTEEAQELQRLLEPLIDWAVTRR